MSLMNSTAERLRRATHLWHAYLTTTGKRFELAQFLKDVELEKQTIEMALASGDPKLVGLAQDWLLGTGQALPPSRTQAALTAPAAPATADAAKPPRYLRGVR